MPTFRVEAHERSITTYMVEAETPEEARWKVRRGMYEEIVGSEFVELLDNSDDWTTELELE